MMNYSEEELLTWKALNQINLTEFMQKTSSSFVILKCRLNRMNCARDWKIRRTYLGACLELITQTVIDESVQLENTKIKQLYSSMVRNRFDRPFW